MGGFQGAYAGHGVVKLMYFRYFLGLESIQGYKISIYPCQINGLNRELIVNYEN
jgi:hypothetical protein